MSKRSNFSWTHLHVKLPTIKFQLSSEYIGIICKFIVFIYVTRERERGYSVWNFDNFCCPLTNSYLCYLLLHNNERRWIHLHLHSKRIKCIWIKISLNIPYPHSQFGTQVSNNYFNYCKVILQLEQYFDQFWGSCIAIVAIQLLVLHLWACV